MFVKQIDIDITTDDGIEKAINELLKIEEELIAKTKEVIHRLAKIGIKVANDKADEEFKPYIDFVKEVAYEDDKSCTLYLIGKNVGQMISQWTLSNGTERQVEINAILMNEVGSGFNVENPDELNGGQQGALNTYGHAFDVKGWYWVDSQGVKHHSKGSKANLSMHSAFVEMNRQINDVVREVFG